MPRIRVITIGPDPSMTRQRWSGATQKYQTRLTSASQRRLSAMSKTAVPNVFVAMAARPEPKEPCIFWQKGRLLFASAYSTVGKPDFNAHQACGATTTAQAATVQYGAAERK